MSVQRSLAEFTTKEEADDEDEGKVQCDICGGYYYQVRKPFHLAKDCSGLEAARQDTRGGDA